MSSNQQGGQQSQFREFDYGKQDQNRLRKFESNFIKTSKYNIVNFLPKCLLVQFKRYANIYFLIIAILQSIPEISPLHPFAAWAPLIFVIALSMGREALEDIQRHKSDIELNSSKCFIYRDGKFKECLWSEVMVGDFCLVKDNDVFPADLILLNSSIEGGVCFIETSSLDGEKNLKPKNSMPETIPWVKDNDAVRILGRIECIHPDPDLYKFEGTIYSEGGSDNKKVLLSSKQFLLRGSRLKNSKWVIGIVCYTGNDTKIMKNADKAKFKQSNIERISNLLILVILIFQMIVSGVSAVGYVLWNEIARSSHYYLQLDETKNIYAEGFLTFLTYIVLNNTMIPISLIVSLEIVKAIQGYIMQNDKEMYSQEKERGPKVFTTSINEELGQIQYIFSDKTGTLTCNKMEFKLCMIGNGLHGDTSVLGDNYFEDNPKKNNQKWGLKKKPTMIDKHAEIIFYETDKGLADKLSQSNEPIQKSQDQSQAIAQSKLQNSKQDNQQNFISQTDTDFSPFPFYNKHGEKIYEIANYSLLAQEFLYLLSTCHECVVEQRNEEDQKEDDLQQQINHKDMRYQGPSPDEVTLVDTARHYGYVFLGGTQNSMKIEVNKKTETIELLKTFSFDSDRKRMSVIIRHKGIIKLYIKGADNVILDRLHKTIDQPFLKKIKEKINVFSVKGLRTLLIAMKVLEEQEYANFDQEYQKLSDAKDREKAINALAETIEKDLYLIGATAVEDKLQDKVPETIRDLLLAKIKVWMLTGDKMETAENIARSCKLIQEHFEVIRFQLKPIKDQSQSDKENQVKQELENKIKETQQIVQNKKQKAFLIEGQDLGQVLLKDEFKNLLIEIVQHCEAVVCCRATPKQKAQVVALVKEKLKKITLAIGDGANDVNMIQEAHIGIGLYGQEGMRAVQASDYALPEFKMLWRLVLVHGRWSYLRIAEMVMYFFYKNLIFTIPQFYFSFTCAYSGQTIFDDWFITLYNIIFTALPLIIRAIVEQDVYYKVEKKYQPGMKIVDPLDRLEEIPQLKDLYPKVYYLGQKNIIFTYTNFLYWMIQGIAHGIIVWVFHVYSLGYDILNRSGVVVDLWLFSISIYTAIIVIVDMKLALNTQYWTTLYVAIITLSSLVLYIAYIWLSSSVESFLVFQTAVSLFKTGDFYLTVAFCVLVVFMFDILLMYFRYFQKAGLIEQLKFLIKSGDLERKKTILSKLRDADTSVNFGRVDIEGYSNRENNYQDNHPMVQ